MTEIKHGTQYAYVGKGCRCTVCTKAFSAYCAEKKRERIARGLPEGDPRHGTKNGYQNYGCRCDQCKAINRSEFRLREAGFGHEVYIKELGGWYVVGEKVD